MPGIARAQARVAASRSWRTTAGADRMQRLIDGAKKEGNLSMYTSAQSDDMGALLAASRRSTASRRASGGPAPKRCCSVQ
jgi:hypothetical protein